MGIANTSKFSDNGQEICGDEGMVCCSIQTTNYNYAHSVAICHHKF